jgi:putative ABC transport system permease protein
MVYGVRENALKEPFSMVLSRSKAEKYYPGQNPIGKVLYLNDNKERAYTIRGVMEDPPANSHLNFDFFLTLSGIEFWDGEQDGWNSSNYAIYTKIKQGTNIPEFNKKVNDGILNKYVIPKWKEQGRTDIQAEISKLGTFLQPVRDIYLKSHDIEYYYGKAGGDIRFIWLFGGVAGFIILIACINFINLSTAKSANRAKEVGLRKVVGSYRSGLMGQFLIESLLFSVISFVIGLLIAWVLLPYFNTMAARSLTMPWTEWWLVPSVILSAIIIGLIAGIYPSVYLSSFNPAEVLKGNLSRGSRSSMLRNSLVIFQFTISIVLIVGTLVIYSQMKYILNSDIGFNKDQVMMLHGTNTMDRKTKSFKNELQKLSAVKSVTISDFLPVDGTKRNGNEFHNEGKTKEEAGVGAQFWDVDHDYAKTFGMEIVAGRYFSQDMPTDSQAVVINQSMAQKLNLKDPIGKMITNGGGHFTIIGVVKDFNFETMRTSIEPLCMHLGNSNSIVSLKLDSKDMQSTIASVTALWKQFAPDQPIRYTFLDESFAKMYDDVQRTGMIFTSFAILAIIIACLGLFALSAFMAEQRNKEIGVRKVLGATVQNITTLLSREFIKLVLMSIVIASPIAWWAMNKWLEDYTYRINISWWMFAVTSLLVILIALFTVSFQAIKAALTNPVKSLRSE